MEKKRRTFWLADTVTARHRDRALLLNQKGFDIQFFTSLSAVMNELEAKRAGVIVVSDDGDEAVTSRMIAHLMCMPEVQGARLIMVRGGNSQSLNFLAACANFRDIIPVDLDEAQWLSRFLFAAGNKPMRLPQPPAQISMSGIAAVAFPARLTWVSARRLRLECRVRPPAGASLNLHGTLAGAVGVSSITLNVVETKRSHLLYRFSDAIICEWTVPQAARAMAEKALKELAEADPGPRCRVFVAAQSADLRAAVLSQFADPRFEVTTALSKQSIAEEPRFFSPDVIFLESVLAYEDDGARLSAVVANTDEHTTIVIIGVDSVPAVLADVTAAHPGRRILRMGKLPKSITQSVLARYLNLSARRMASEEADARQILPENPLSLAEVSFPARLTRLHPATAQLALPYQVGNFALCRVEAPALRRYVRRNPYGKLSAVYIDTHPDAAAFPHLVDVSLSDLSAAEQKQLARGLSDHVQQALGLMPREAAVLPLKHAAGAEAAGDAGAAGDTAGATDARVNAAFARLDPTPPKLVEPKTTAGARKLDAPASQGGTRRVEALEPLAGTRRFDAVEPAPGLRKVDALEPEPVAPAPEAPKPPQLPTFLEMIKPASQPVLRTKRVRNQVGADGFVTIAKYVAFVAFAIGVLWAMTTLVAPHYEKDGSVYSEGLKKLQGQKP